MALALGDAAGEQGDRAGLVEPYLGALEALRGRALDGVGEADAAQLAALTRFGAPALEAGEIGERKRHVHALLELAAVVGEGEPGLERHGLGRDVVPAPQLGGIDAEFVGGEIDQPLDHIGRLRAAVAAIGPHRIGVREHGGDVGMDGGRAIDAGERADIAGEGGHAGLQIGADAGDGVHAQPEEAAVAVERKLGLRDVVARLGIAQKRFRARRGPFDRPAHAFRRQQHQRHFVIDRRFHSEAAADVAGDHPDLALRHLQDRRQLGAEGMRTLQRRVDGVAVLGRIVVADRAARLHAGGGDAVDHEAMLDDVGGVGEGGIGRGLVAEELHETDIVRALIPHPRRASGGGLRGRHDRGERLVVDRNQLGGVLGLDQSLRHHEGDIIAGPAHAVFDKRGIGRPKRAAVAALQSAGDRQVAPSRGLPVRAGEHREHPRRRLGLARVDRADARMRVRGAQHIAEHHAWQHDVADIAAAAPEQPRILEPGHALTDREFTHLNPRSCRTLLRLSQSAGALATRSGAGRACDQGGCSALRCRWLMAR